MAGELDVDGGFRGDTGLKQPESKDGKATGTQLLDRSVAILTYLAAHGQQGASATTLAEMLGLNASTAHRIISGLERHGFIEKEESTKRYRLGLTLFSLGAQSVDDSGYRRLCRPILLDLAAATGDTVFLMAKSGFNAICVDRQEGHYIIDSLTGRIGGEIPLGVGPASQSILAFMDEAEAAVVLAENKDRYSAFNGLSAGEIRKRLPQIRELGYAFDHGRLVEGISAVAVPIRLNGREAIGSISINMTSARLKDDRLSELVSMLIDKVSMVELHINPLQFPAIAKSGGQQIYE